MPQPDPPRYRFGRLGISCVDMGRALDAFYAIAEEGSGGYLAFTCAHGIVESERDDRLCSVINASRMTLPDGAPTVWLGRIKGASIGRVAAPDFLTAALEDPRAVRLRHYFYGGSPRALARIVDRARTKLGDRAIAGWHSPPLRAPGEMEDAEVIDRIARSRPHAIWVGLGLPKQELWMANHARLLPDSVMLGVGAAFDWYAGMQPRAPHVVQAAGLEWLHRVVSEPRRLGPRYGALLRPAMGIFARELAAHLTGRSPQGEPKRMR